MRPPLSKTDRRQELLIVQQGKWALSVIMQLRGGKRRFNELRRDLGNVPQKSLSYTLHKLERDGFVSRTAYATIPPKVEYRLTALGQELLVLSENWLQFAKDSRRAVTEARRQFDTHKPLH